MTQAIMDTLRQGKLPEGTAITNQASWKKQRSDKSTEEIDQLSFLEWFRAAEPPANGTVLPGERTKVCSVLQVLNFFSTPNGVSFDDTATAAIELFLVCKSLLIPITVRYPMKPGYGGECFYTNTRELRKPNLCESEVTWSTKWVLGQTKF